VLPVVVAVASQSIQMIREKVMGKRLRGKGYMIRGMKIKFKGSKD
jgi:uncharacterized lipoprotein YajG